MLTSSKIKLDARRRTYVRLIGEARHVLNEAFMEEAATRSLTKGKMAARLGKHPSFVTRKMNGTSNMTLETFADLAYSMDRTVGIVLRRSREVSDRANDTKPPEHHLIDEGVSKQSPGKPGINELLISAS